MSTVSRINHLVVDSLSSDTGYFNSLSTTTLFGVDGLLNDTLRHRRSLE